MSEAETPDLTTLTVELLSAYFANNIVASEDLAGLIQSTRSALAGKTAPDDQTLDVRVYKPAVSIKKSIASADHLISLIDGKPYKTLKRHLTSHGLTIAEYKERYKLPANYPTVAPSYSEARRETASRIGLGNRSATAIPLPAEPGAADAAIISEVVPAAPVGRAMKKALHGRASTAKTETASKSKPKAKAKPRVSKPSLNAETKVHAPVETTEPSIPLAVDDMVVGKPRQKAVVKTDPVQSAPVMETAKPARKPRAKLKIVAPAA